MLTCSACNTVLPDDAAFCSECGAAQPVAAARTAPAQENLTLGAERTIGPDDIRQAQSAVGGKTLEVGSIFASRYEIEGLIGRGGMGAVYRARDTLTGKTSALKIVAPHLMGSESAVQRLIGEGATAQDIRHENVVSVYDVGKADGLIFISMEMVDGTPLREWIKRQSTPSSVSMRIAARIIVELLEGLKAAHAKGVIHRDLKPENIILIGEPNDREAKLKILDFGIARKVDTASGNSGSSALGSIHYMAPEQKTNPDAAGPAADLYSVSKIFYELLVSVLPSGYWQPPSGGRTDVPAGIDELIRRGLSDAPQLRPQSASDYVEMLKTVMNGGQLSRRTYPPVDDHKIEHETGKSAGTGMPGWLVAAGGGVIGLIVLVSIIATAMSGSVEPSYTPPPEPEVIIDPVRTLDTRGPSLSLLSGSWTDGGAIIEVDVAPNGRFSGAGVVPNGDYIEVSGRIPGDGSEGSYTMSYPDYGTSSSGTISWDRGCHVSTTLRPVNPAYPASQYFHIDHPARPGPCPARFN